MRVFRPENHPEEIDRALPTRQPPVDLDVLPFLPFVPHAFWYHEYWYHRPARRNLLGQLAMLCARAARFRRGAKIVNQRLSGTLADFAVRR